MKVTCDNGINVVVVIRNRIKFYKFKVGPERERMYKERLRRERKKKFKGDKLDRMVTVYMKQENRVPLCEKKRRLSVRRKVA